MNTKKFYVSANGKTTSNLEEIRSESANIGLRLFNYAEVTVLEKKTRSQIMITIPTLKRTQQSGGVEVFAEYDDFTPKQAEEIKNLFRNNLPTDSKRERYAWYTTGGGNDFERNIAFHAAPMLKCDGETVTKNELIQIFNHWVDERTQ